MFVFNIVYDFFAGAITTVTAVIHVTFCPTSDVIGVQIGMLLVPWALGLLIGEPIGGAILASAVVRTGLQIFTGAVILAAVALGVVVRGWRYGQGLETKC